MQEEPFQLDAQGQIYLIHEGKKFWSLSINHRNNHVVIRVGPLDSDGFEIEEKCLKLTKKHKDLTNSLGYAEYHMNLKQEKEYQKGIRRGSKKLADCNLNSKRPGQDNIRVSLDKRFKQNPDSPLPSASQALSSSSLTSDKRVQERERAFGQILIIPQDESQVSEKKFQEKLKQMGDKTLSPLGAPLRNPYENLGKPREWQEENPTGWYMVEKLEGIRCVWTGSEFQSENGSRYNPPGFFVEDFPESPLDGIFYAGKGKISDCKNILNSTGTSGKQKEPWLKSQFYVYDAMGAEGTFVERFVKLREAFSTNISKFIKLCDYKKCESLEDFNKEFQRIKDEKGEGIVLKNPKSYYQGGTCQGFFEKRTQDENI